MAGPEVKIRSCDPSLLTSPTATVGSSVEDVVEKAKGQHAGFEEIVDEFVCYDPETEVYFLDEEALNLQKQNAIKKAQFDLECAVNPTEACEAFKAISINSDKITEYREKYDENVKDLERVGDGIKEIAENDPLFKLIGIAGGGLALGGVGGWTLQFLLHGPAMDLAATLASKKAILQEIYMRNEIGERMAQDKDVSTYRADLVKCGFNVPLYPPHVAKAIALYTLGAIAAITSLMSVLGFAMFNAYKAYTNHQKEKEAHSDPVSDGDFQEEEGLEFDFGGEVAPADMGTSVDLADELEKIDVMLGQSIANLEVLKQKKTLSNDVKEVLEKIERRLNSGNYEVAREMFEDEYIPLGEEQFTDPILFESYKDIYVNLEEIFSLSDMSLWLRQNQMEANFLIGGSGLAAGAFLMMSQGEIIMDFSLKAYRALPFRANRGIWDVVHQMDNTVDQIFIDARLRATGSMDCSEEGLNLSQYDGFSNLNETSDSGTADGTGSPEASLDNDILAEASVEEASNPFVLSPTFGIDYSAGSFGLLYPQQAAGTGQVSQGVQFEMIKTPANMIVMEPVMTGEIAVNGGRVYASVNTQPRVVAVYEPTGGGGTVIELSTARGGGTSTGPVTEGAPIQGDPTVVRHTPAEPGGVVAEIVPDSRYANQRTVSPEGIENTKAPAEVAEGGKSAKTPARSAGTGSALKSMGLYAGGAVVINGTLIYLDAPEDMVDRANIAYGGYGLYSMWRTENLALLSHAPMGMVGAGVVTDLTSGPIQNTDWDPETKAVAHVSSGVVGGVGGAGGSLLLASRLGMSNPVTFGVGLVVGVGYAAHKDYKKTGALKEARAEFIENNQEHPIIIEKFEEIDALMEETFGFVVNAACEIDGEVIAKINALFDGSLGQEILTKFGWYFVEKYINYFQMLVPAPATQEMHLNSYEVSRRKEIHENYGRDIELFRLRLLYPAIGDVLVVAEDVLQVNRFSDDGFRRLEAIINDPNNKDLFATHGQVLVESYLIPFLQEIGYYDASLLDQAAAYIFPDDNPALTAKKEEIKNDYGMRIGLLKHTVQYPYADEFPLPSELVTSPLELSVPVEGEEVYLVNVSGGAKTVDDVEEVDPFEITSEHKRKAQAIYDWVILKVGEEEARWDSPVFIEALSDHVTNKSKDPVVAGELIKLWIADVEEYLRERRYPDFFSVDNVRNTTGVGGSLDSDEEFDIGILIYNLGVKLEHYQQTAEGEDEILSDMEKIVSEIDDKGSWF